jgi:hypothetical protein
VKLLGSLGGPAVEIATAGWTAGFLASIAMYFQTAATRDTDRRVVIAGLPAHRLVGARLGGLATRQDHAGVCLHESAASSAKAPKT